MYLVLRLVTAYGLAAEGVVDHASSHAETELGGARDPSLGVTVQL